MLYSIILGNQNEVSNDWKIEKEEYGAFIANDAIRQRIKLGPNIMEKLEVNYTTPNINAYNLSDKIFFTNNYKNMNLMIRSFFSKDRDKVASHVDDSIVYVTMLNTNYKLLSYVSNSCVEIIQSYHMKNKFVGCAMTFRDKIEEPTTLITINAKDIKNDNFVKIEIIVNSTHKIEVKKTVVDDTNELSKLDNLSKKFAKFFLGFKMDIKPEKFITKAYIVSNTKEKEFTPKLSKIKDPVVIEIDGDEIPELDEELKHEFLNAIGDSRCKAVTIYGVKVPKNFARELGFYYMFEYDDKANKLKCIHSN